MTNFEIRQISRKLLGGSLFQREWLIAALFLGLMDVLVAVASSLLFGIGGLIISGPITVSISCFLLNRMRTRNDFEIRDLLHGVENDAVGNIVLGVRMGLITFLYTLLLIVPGIIKSYSYAMAGYIKNDNPDLSPKACMDESENLMRGNKWKLFCLDVSFIGWYLLGGLCFGIGSLFVVPYHYMAKTVFYETLVGDPKNVYVNDNSFGELN